jgi:uncharacterized protein YbjQ (UPF0145 family)
MIVTASDQIPGRPVKQVLGLVMGNTIRAKHLGKDIVAGLRNIVGGELNEYTEMLAESRAEAINRMQEEAKKMGADAIVTVRFTTSSVMQSAAEMLAYGTAVKLK